MPGSRSRTPADRAAIGAYLAGRATAVRLDPDVEAEAVSVLVAVGCAGRSLAAATPEVMVARQLLEDGYRWLVVWLALREPGPGEVAERLARGHEGLVRAILSFEGRGRFGGAATWWVRRAIAGDPSPIV